MLLPEKNYFLEQIDSYDENLKDKFILLYDSAKAVGNKEIDTNELIQECLNLLFNPNAAYKETLIPMSFFQSAIGKLMLSILNESNERFFTISELVNLTKTKEKPEGFTIQYITQEIKANRLKAVKDSYRKRWIISESEVNRFLKSKGIIKD